MFPISITITIKRCKCIEKKVENAREKKHM